VVQSVVCVVPVNGETDMQMVKRPGQRMAMERRLAAGRQGRSIPASERTSGLFYGEERS